MLIYWRLHAYSRLATRENPSYASYPPSPSPLPPPLLHTQCRVALIFLYARPDCSSDSRSGSDASYLSAARGFRQLAKRAASFSFLAGSFLVTREHTPPGSGRSITPCCVGRGECAIKLRRWMVIFVESSPLSLSLSLCVCSYVLVYLRCARARDTCRNDG